MQFSSTFFHAAALSLLVPGVLAGPQTREVKAPIALTKLFTVVLSVGSGIPPIPVPGGIRKIDAYKNGTVVGSVFKGVILGGIGTPVIYGGGAATLPNVLLYGMTNDGVPFFVQQAGNGNPTSLFSRVQLEIGGIYANYSNAFLLGSVTESADMKTITAVVYQPSIKI